MITLSILTTQHTVFPPEGLQCQTRTVSVVPIPPCHIDLLTDDHTGLCVKDRGVTEASADFSTVLL